MFTQGTQGQKFGMNLCSLVCASFMVLGCGGADLNYAEDNGKAEKKSQSALEVLLDRSGDETKIIAGGLVMTDKGDGDLQIDVADGSFIVRSDGELEVLEPIEDVASLEEILAASASAVSNMLPEVSDKPEAEPAVNYLEVSMNDDAGVLSPDELKWFGAGVLTLYTAGLGLLVVEAGVTAASAEALLVSVKAERDIATASTLFGDMTMYNKWVTSMQAAVQGVEAAKANVFLSEAAKQVTILMGSLSFVSLAELSDVRNVRIGACDSDGSACLVDSRPLFDDIDALP